jgi:hypothetical protein
MIRFKSAVAGGALGLVACAGMSNAPARLTDGVSTNSAGMTGY